MAAIRHAVRGSKALGWRIGGPGCFDGVAAAGVGVRHLDPWQLRFHENIVCRGLSLRLRRLLGFFARLGLLLGSLLCRCFSPRPRSSSSAERYEWACFADSASFANMV